MSQENVEIVERFYESVTAQDLDGVLDCVDAEIELDWSRLAFSVDEASTGGTTG